MLSKRKLMKFWDKLMKATSNSKASHQQVNTCSNGQGLPSTIQVSSNPRREKSTIVASSSHDLEGTEKLSTAIEQLMEISKRQEETSKRQEEISKRLKEMVDQLVQKHDEKQNGHIGLLEAEAARIEDSCKENTRTEDRISSSSYRTARSEDHDSSMKEEQLHKLSPLVGKSDTISVADVVRLFKVLITDIKQASSIMGDLLSCRETSISAKELEDVLDELTIYIGPWLCNDLRSQAKEFSNEPDPLITPIALQSALTKACGYIINNENPPSNGATLSRGRGDMVGVGQAEAEVWKAHPHAYTTASQRENLEIHRKYLEEIVLKTITATGGSFESGGVLPLQHIEVLEEIVRESLELHKVLNEDFLSTMELVTYTVSYDTPFDPSRMEDTEGDASESGSGTVICTLQAGLQYRKKGSEKDWHVVVKAKVVLASTLEAYRKGR